MTSYDLIFLMMFSTASCDEENYVSVHHHHVTQAVTSSELDQSSASISIETSPSPEREETSPIEHSVHTTLPGEDIIAMHSTQSSSGVSQTEHSTQSSVGLQSETVTSPFTPPSRDSSHSSVTPPVSHHSTSSLDHSTSAPPSDKSIEHHSSTTHAYLVSTSDVTSTLSPSVGTSTKRPKKHRTHRPHKTRPTRKPTHLDSSTSIPISSSSSSILDYTTTISATVTTTNKTAVSTASDLIRKHWVTTLIFLAFVSVFIIAVILLIFGLCQARSNERLCWNSHYYQPVPTLYQNGGPPKVMVTKIRCDHAVEGDGVVEVVNNGKGTEKDGITYPVT